MASTRTSGASPHTEELDEQMIVPHMLTVQGLKLAKLNEKPRQWFKDLKCLSVDPAWEGTLRLDALPYGKEYIAVSYCCEPMEEFEKYPSKTFWIHDVKNGSIGKSATRDLVITRVLNYAKDQYFWIAEDCIDQRNDEAKLLGRNSMDLVYKASQLSLGLLPTVLSEASDMQQLQVLLSGGLVHFKDIAHLRVNKKMCKYSKRDHTIELLGRIRDDSWWNRQWIFQEEHLAGTKMILLVRHDPGLERDKRGIFEQETAEGELEGTPGVTMTKGELCIEATHFRAEVTKFLLAQLRCKICDARFASRFAKGVKCFWAHSESTISCMRTMSRTGGKPCLPGYSQT